MNIKDMTTTALLERKRELELVLKPEETTDYIRIPVPKEEGKHEGHRIRTIDIDTGKGIKALYCGQCKVVITWLFAKEGHNWTLESAQAWVREHGKSVVLFAIDSEAAIIIPQEVMPKEKPISQATIIDEIDYLKGLIAQVGLSEDGIKSLRGLLERLPGNDIPVEIKPKVEPIKGSPPLDVKEVAQEVARIIAQMRGKIN